MYGTRRASRMSKAAAGHFAKAGVEAGHTLTEEFRVTKINSGSSSRAASVRVDTFSRRSVGRRHRDLAG